MVGCQDVEHPVHPLLAVWFSKSFHGDKLNGSCLKMERPDSGHHEG